MDGLGGEAGDHVHGVVGDADAALVAIGVVLDGPADDLTSGFVSPAGLEADVVVPASAVPEGFGDDDLAELFITASVTRGDSADVTVTRTSENKCGRCWRLLPSVAEDGDLCDRCEPVVAQLDAAR